MLPMHREIQSGSSQQYMLIRSSYGGKDCEVNDYNLV